MNSCLRRKNIGVFAMGVRTPSHAIAGIHIEYIISLSKIWQCITPSEGLALANSLISGKEIEATILKYKKKMRMNTEENDKHKSEKEGIFLM
jgi:hypothetical protein